MNTPLPTVRRPRRWPWILLALAVLLVAAVVGIGQALDAAALDAPVHVIVDGEEVFSGLHFASLTTLQQLAVAVVIVFVLLAVTIVVPAAVLAGLGVGLLGLLLGLGIPLLVLALIGALLLGPVALLVWGLWRLSHRRATPAAGAANPS